MCNIPLPLNTVLTRHFTYELSPHLLQQACYTHNGTSITILCTTSLPLTASSPQQTMICVKKRRHSRLTRLQICHFRKQMICIPSHGQPNKALFCTYVENQNHITPLPSRHLVIIPTSYLLRVNVLRKIYAISHNDHLPYPYDCVERIIFYRVKSLLIASEMIPNL